MPQLAAKEYCTGCTACASVCPHGCITMTANQDGFLHPSIDAKSCVNCNLCEKVCPVINPLKLGGNTPKAYAVYSKDETVRMQSSSGGVFTEVARIVLNDGGVVYGAAYNEQFEVVHICAETEEDLAKLRSAKYAQSDLRGIFPEIKARLDKGQKVLFSGTPCQVLGLKTYLKKEYHNLIMVDLVCHSVPSPLVWKKYLEYISADKTLAAVNLRCKDTGWSRYGYSNRFDFSDNTYSMNRSSESLYMKFYGGGYISSLACANCPVKGYDRVSDLTLGDFWGIWDIAPEWDDDRGTSLVLVHTGKGAAALEGLEKRVVTLSEASHENPAIIRSAAQNPKREEIMELIRAGHFDEAAMLLTSPPVHSRPGLLRRGMAFLKRRITRRQ